MMPLERRDMEVSFLLLRCPLLEVKLVKTSISAAMVAIAATKLSLTGLMLEDMVVPPSVEYKTMISHEMPPTKI